MKEELREATKKNKSYLNSINVDEIIKIMKEKLSQEEVENIAGASSVFYKIYFEKVLQRMTYEQVLKSAGEDETQEQMLYSKGIIKGFEIVKEWFDEQNIITIDDEEEFEEIK